jgi:hypothetical protein
LANDTLLSLPTRDYQRRDGVVETSKSEGDVANAMLTKTEASIVRISVFVLGRRRRVCARTAQRRE